MTNNVEIKDLKKAISLGNIQLVLDELINFTEGSSSNMTTNIYLISARYRTLEGDKLRGVISLEDYKLEFNVIVAGLLKITDEIQHAAIGSYRQVNPIDQVRMELAELSKKFKETEDIKSLTSRYRSEIHLTRQMAEKLIPWHRLLKEYEGTDDPAMICAIARKVKMVTEVKDLGLLESILPNAKSTVEKGGITNALAEMIYSSQLMWGDEVRVQIMLDKLKAENPGDRLLLTNVERVQAALDVMTGIMKQP